jgi:acyl carrier protein
MNEFYIELAEILDVDECGATYVLEESGNWDSLTFLSVVAFAEQKYSLTLRVADIRKAKTAGELFQVLQAAR